MTRYLVALSASLTVAVSHAAAQDLTSQSRDPRPEPAIPAMLAAFDTFQVVAIGDYHTDQEIKNFILSLVRHPRFPHVVNAIVVEGTNGLLQPLLDRYIAGENVPVMEARPLWRDLTNPAGLNEFSAQLVQLVRRINQSLPATRRLRVVAGEDGIDWPAATVERYQQYGNGREQHIATILETEIIRKRQKALMFYGGAHVRHGVRNPEPGWGNAMEYFESRFPGVTFVIYPYLGGTRGNTCGTPASINGVSVDSRLELWDVPSLARTKDTWLADLAKAAAWRTRTMVAAQLGRSVADTTVLPIDAYLYLGRPELHVATLPSVVQFADTAYLAELWRRQRAIGQARRDPRTDPDQVRDRDSNILICQPSRRP